MSNEGDWCRSGSMDMDFHSLPEDCIATVISLMSPGDACRLSLLSKPLRSIADSDTVWTTFLPPECDSLLSKKLSRFSKKQMFRYLCENSVLFDGRKKSFSLDKWSGKKSYNLSARDLDIVWGDTSSYWKWTSHPESRFPEVAELLQVCWLEIRGKISTSLLSDGTLYAAYLKFNAKPGAFGFQHQPVTVTFGTARGKPTERTVYLDMKGGPRRRSYMRTRTNDERARNRIQVPREVRSRDESNFPYSLPKVRGDGWLEVELGEFYYSGGSDSEVEMSVSENKGGSWKGGIVVEGIEIRPKRC